MRELGVGENLLHKSKKAKLESGSLITLLQSAKLTDTTPDTLVNDKVGFPK